MKAGLTFFLLIVSLAATASAQPPSSYCESLTGNWSGTYTDDNKVFSGGPWPIVMQTQYADGRFIGIMTSGNSNIPPQGAYIWGECKNNQLTNVQVHENSQSCKTNSSGSLANANTLTLNYQWQWQNNPNKTTFNINLKKANSKSGNLSSNNVLRHYLATGEMPNLQDCSQ